MTMNTTLMDEVFAHHGANAEALVEILRDLNQVGGYLSPATVMAVAERLGLPLGRVYGVASFYSMMSVEPGGQHLVQMCQDAPCHIAGGREVWVALEETLGIAFGETSADGKWTLQPVSCLGLCAVGPVVQIDGEVYGNMTPEKVRELLARFTEMTGGAA